jgi:hypothetical protein
MESGGVRSGDRGGQSPRPTTRSQDKSCKKPVVCAVRAVFPSCWNQQSRSFSCSKETDWNTNLWRLQRTFMQCIWVFSTPYSTVLTTNVSTQVEPCFACKTQTVQHANLLLWKKSLCRLRNYRITEPTKLRQDNELVLNDSADAGSVHRSRGALLVVLFQYLYTADIWVAPYTVNLHNVCTHIY